MTTEYRLSYTASEIDENLKKISELPIEKGTGENSIIIGNGGNTIGNSSAIIGIDNISGCKGYYIKNTRKRRTRIIGKGRQLPNFLCWRHIC